MLLVKATKALSNGARSRLLAASPTHHYWVTSSAVLAPNTPQAVVHFSTRTQPAQDPSSLATLQERTWKTYLANGRGSEALFQAIDYEHRGEIVVKDLHFFLDNIQQKGVHPRAFKVLDELAHGHPMTLREFKSWLVLATELGHDKNTSYLDDYFAHPQTGAKPAAKKAATSAVTTSSEEEPYRSWNEVTMNQAIRRMQYAVRGSVVMKADKLASEGRDILYTNIGNPQAVQQPPITYFRQVMALCDLPASVGVDHPKIADVFPKDVVERAKEMRAEIGSAGTGAYTHSQGVLAFRNQVANYIQQRDGGQHPSYPGNIFLTNGASTAIELVLTTLIGSDLDGIMIPIPQYPIYSALIAKLGGRQVPYYLDEGKNWAVSLEELEKRLGEAQEEGLLVKALAIINPGNPTGQVYTRQDLEVICQFCSDNGIVLLADEVYQRNIYAEDKEFLSAKKVGLEMSPDVADNLQVVSFHSTSKGLIGECGRRGGYMELHNIDPYVQSQLYKLASSGLCSNLDGQVMMSLMVNPPAPTDESYALFAKEESAIFDGLKRRAKALVKGLNQVDGIDCNPAEGAMYAFPRIQIPPGAIAEAEKQNTTPDTLYALSLLEDTGICVVPASGFGQEEGRYGFRTTFLPPDEKMMAAIDKFASHHETFCRKYSS